MKTTLTLINPTKDAFARVLLANGSTISYTDPIEADHMLEMFFELNSTGREAYYNAPKDESWEHTKYSAAYSHYSL